MNRPQLATFAAAGMMTATADQAPTVDLAARTISGLLVPFGKVGQTSAGRVKFSAGSITWHEDVSRVKFLVEHDQRASVGYATEVAETPAGLTGTFHVPEGDAGDAVLLHASNKVRDGLSVGVQLDDATLTKLRRSQGEAVDGRGVLRETSAVSVPAFDDSRVSAVAHTDLVVSAWADQHTPARREDHPVTTTTDAAQATEGQPITREDLAAAFAAAGLTTAAAGAGAPSETTPAPAPAAAPLATAGAAAVIESDPSVYTFSGAAGAPSLVRDAYAARVDGNADARDRLQRFNTQLTDGNPSSVMALAAVAKTTDTALDPGDYVLRTQFRPDLMRQAINRGRPIISRLTTTPISSSTPFAIPSEGEFSGVGDHVEGTAHVAEGTLTMGDAMVTPGAVSGAYRISRELIDAYNPAIDGIALRAMIRDYRKFSEGKAAAIFNALSADKLSMATTAMALRGELIAFSPNDDDVAPDFVLLGKTLLASVAGDVDGNDRAQLTVNGQPGDLGTLSAGYTGLSIDGHAIGKSSRLTAVTGIMATQDAVIWAESSTQTFRFDEVEGPGVLKLALFGYCGGGIYSRAGVRKFTTAAS